MGSSPSFSLLSGDDQAFSSLFLAGFCKSFRFSVAVGVLICVWALLRRITNSPVILQQGLFCFLVVIRSFIVSPFFEPVLFSGFLPVVAASLMVCPWPFMASLDTSIPKPSAPRKSFAEVLSDTCDIQLTQLPPKVVMGDTVRIKITQEELDSGISDCRINLHGRITLAKGDTPLTTQALKNKLCILWPTLKEWHVLPLGRGFFEFQLKI